MSNTLGIALLVNIGTTDFPLEFWLRVFPGESNSSPCTEREGTGIYG